VESLSGDPLRSWSPPIFAFLNQSKYSLSVDLSRPEVAERIRQLAKSCDILIEQFRPGVMARLGLGYSDIRPLNPRLVYCSITGFGQDGSDATIAGHDLMYQAKAGLLPQSDLAPLPSTLLADIGAGGFAAALNILLALRRAEHTGSGCHLDISMTDGLLAWQLDRVVSAMNPVGQGDLADRLHGSSPRYAIYRTLDGQYLAAAPLEDKFWKAFADLIGLPDQLRDDARTPAATSDAVAQLIAAKPAAHWVEAMGGKDVCCALVLSLHEAVEAARRRHPGRHDPSLDWLLPVDPALYSSGSNTDSPTLGEHNDRW
jgi:alpha-methylacyl-CoA racemase